MEKKKKKADLEQLLNSLIEKGWKPFGDNDVIRVKYWYSVHFLCRPIVNFVLDWYAEATVPLKEILTSRSSWLWQFVCENGMVEYKNYWVDTEIWQDEQYQYRLIETSLKNEDELEQFLLDNIIINEQA